jgi:hypothetical protein
VSLRSKGEREGGEELKSREEEGEGEGEGGVKSIKRPTYLAGSCGIAIISGGIEVTEERREQGGRDGAAHRKLPLSPSSPVPWREEGRANRWSNRGARCECGFVAKNNKERSASSRRAREG